MCFLEGEEKEKKGGRKEGEERSGRGKEGRKEGEGGSQGLFPTHADHHIFIYQVVHAD